MIAKDRPSDRLLTQWFGSHPRARPPSPRPPRPAGRTARVRDTRPRPRPERKCRPRR
jgi:hypothetical protein